MKKINFALAAMMALACACSNDDSTTTQDNNNEGDFTGVILPPVSLTPTAVAAAPICRALGI